MAAAEVIRVGFIGAGGICRTRHLPGLAAIPGVQVVAVANRTLDSGRRVAKEFGIPEALEDWRRLLERSDIDAVFIGTWPCMHEAMSVAALNAGKHVFCQARMAMDLAQARGMLRAAQAHPGLVNMICPPPHRMPFEPFIRQVLASGDLGPITAVQLTSVSSANVDPRVVTWRERVELSGRQALTMGILAETLNAWVGPYERLSAQIATPLAVKTDADGQNVPIAIPQVITITGRLACGALCTEHHTGLAVDTSTVGEVLTIWGARGTLRHRFMSGVVEMAKAGEALKAVEVPAALRREWWAESQFIEAVRLARAGRPWSVTPDFAEGMHYMRKVEAVYESAATGRAVCPGLL